MVTFLLSLLPVSLAIWCIHILFQEGHLLEKQGEWMENNWPEYIVKPLFGCPICQSSFWGLIGFHALDYIFGVQLPYRQLIPYIFCLCGLQTILAKLTSKERIITEE